MVRGEGLRVVQSHDTDLSEESKPKGLVLRDLSSSPLVLESRVRTFVTDSEVHF